MRSFYERNNVFTNQLPIKKKEKLPEHNTRFVLYLFTIYL